MKTSQNLSKDSVLMSMLIVVFFGCVGLGMVADHVEIANTGSGASAQAVAVKTATVSRV